MTQCLLRCGALSVLVLLCWPVFPTLSAQAETPAAAPSEPNVAAMRAAARAALRGSPSASVEAWRALVAAVPDDGEAWHRLGYALHMRGDIEAALAAHRRATELHFSPTSAFNVACALALLGRADEALEALDAAVEQGYVDHEHTRRDSDLAGLRADPRFDAALERMREAALERDAARIKVAVLVYPGVELLDFAGPLEAFSAASDRRGRKFHAFTVAHGSSPMRTDGVRIVADHTFDDCPLPRIIVIPGGGVSAVTDHAPTMKWLAKIRPNVDVAMSVCNGAMVLARLGALDGRSATTHHGSIARLARAFPEVNVVPGARFVDSGEVVTAAGVSAGIDGALHVIERYFDRDVAWSAARYMEYEWRPDRIGPYGLDDARKGATRAAIAAAVDHYLDGCLREGGGSHVEASLHRDLDKIGFGRARDERGHHKTYPRGYDAMLKTAERLAERGPRDGAFGEFEILDVQDLIAVVKVRATWGYDYLTLGRFGDCWLVRHILWQQHLEEPK